MLNPQQGSKPRKTYDCQSVAASSISVPLTCASRTSSLRRHLKEARNAYDREHKLHTFSVGLRGSPDLVAARRVADHLGTIHHEFTFTVQDGLDALEDLIWHLESVEQARADRVVSWLPPSRSAVRSGVLLSCSLPGAGQLLPPFRARQAARTGTNQRTGQACDAAVGVFA